MGTEALASVYQAAELPGQCEVLDVALSSVNVTGQPLTDHLCSVKCPMCVGAECYCESPSDGALCLPEPLCRAACDAEPSCEAYSVRWDGTPLCTLSGTGAIATPADAQWTCLTPLAGTPCTDPDDYEPANSKVYVTEVATELGVEYVVPPSVPVTLEVPVTYPSLALDSRIAVIPDGAACGRAEPSRTVHAAGGAGWPAWTALPAQLAAYPTSPRDALPPPSRRYRLREDRFCKGENLHFPVPGGEILQPFLCFEMCRMDCRFPEGCACEGFFHGHDSRSSNVLCADKHLCAQLCDATPGCDSFEVHHELPRCFLNTVDNCDDGRTGGTSYHAEELPVSDGYDLYIARHDPNDETTYPHTSYHVFTPTPVPTAAPTPAPSVAPTTVEEREIGDGFGTTEGLWARRATEEEEPDWVHYDRPEPVGRGISPPGALDYRAWWEPSSIVFKDITFAAGTYTVCFCDVPPCEGAADFRITLGRSHASGVSGLLEEPQLRTVRECTPLPDRDEDPGFRCTA